MSITRLLWRWKFYNTTKLTILLLVTPLALFYCRPERHETIWRSWSQTSCSREWTIFKNCTQYLSYEFYNLTEFNFTKNYQANSKTITRINENCLSVQQSFEVLNCSHLYFLTLEFLISVHANFHHTSSNQGSNESLNARMSFTTIASSLVLLSISPPLIWHSISTLSIRKMGEMSLGALN